MKPALTVLAALGLLAGCAHGELDAIDDAAFAEATLATQAPPVEILAVPEAVPLPGQLQPLEREVDGDGDRDGDGILEPEDPETVVARATDAATIEPSSEGYVNAIQVFPYAEGALYRLYAAPGRISEIALEPGEAIRSVSAGDTVRWIVDTTSSGDAKTSDNARAHVLVKPTEPRLATNLTIFTDRRTYHLALISTRSTYVASLSWRYPRGEIFAIETSSTQAADRGVDPARLAVDPRRLDFGYEISGDAPPWRPIAVFDDGAKVYIRFAGALARIAAPPLFVIGYDEAAEIVNYRIQGDYYVVDQLFRAAELRLGEEEQQIVRIERAGAEAPAGLASTAWGE